MDPPGSPVASHDRDSYDNEDWRRQGSQRYVKRNSLYRQAEALALAHRTNTAELE